MYAIQYDDQNGEILNVVDAQFADSNDWIVTALPTYFVKSHYYVKNIDGTNYFIDGTDGYAYDSDGNRSSEHDQEPTLLVEETLSDEETLGDDGETEYLEEEGFAEETTLSEDADVNVYGRGDIMKIVLPLGTWVKDSVSAYNERTGWFIKTLYNGNITQETILYILGVNQEAVLSDIFWQSGEGKITFFTDTEPLEDIEITVVLREATGSVGRGRINAWPGKQFRAALYLHSLHMGEEKSISLASGMSINISTPVDFASATLLFAAPQWTGNTWVTIPKIYVDSSSKKLCFTLMNMHPSETAVITEVELRLLFAGTLSGLVVPDGVNIEQSNSASYGGSTISGSYITNPDIDGLGE